MHRRLTAILTPLNRNPLLHPTRTVATHELLRLPCLFLTRTKRLLRTRPPTARRAILIIPEMET